MKSNIKSRRPFLCWLSILVALCSVPVARASLYQIDDGTAEDAIGLTSGGDLIALNQFNVIGGNNMIGSVSIAWGAPNNPDPSLNGLSYTAVIWSDPNNDGNPNDATVLTTASGVISNAGTDTFLTTLFPCVTVTRSFFVGFIITQFSGQFPAAFDETAPLNNRSFIAGSSTPGGGNINNLTSPSNDLPLNAIENYGFNGNWLIRADPCAVPEPSTMTLATLGGLAGLIGCRRKLRNLFAIRSYPGHARGSAGVIIVGGHRNASRSQSGTRAAITLPRSLTHGGELRRSFASHGPRTHLKHSA